MIRSLSIFSFFACSTILIIVLQPGPRETHTLDSGYVGDATRNDLNVLRDDPAMSQGSLELPDEVILKIKQSASAASDVSPVQPVAVQTQPTRSASMQLGGSVRTDETPSVEMLDTTVRAALAVPTPQAAPVEQAATMQDAAAYDAPVAAAPVPSGLRDMSWQTLNQLSRLGTTNTAPGAEGSLLGSIVRRSMTHVNTAPTQPVARTAPVAAEPDIQYFRPQSTVSPGMQTYTVTSGDTLALIAIKLYGSALSREKLIADNPELRANPDVLRIGQVLKYRGS